MKKIFFILAICLICKPAWGQYYYYAPPVYVPQAPVIIQQQIIVPPPLVVKPPRTICAWYIDPYDLFGQLLGDPDLVQSCVIAP